MLLASWNKLEAAWNHSMKVSLNHSNEDSMHKKMKFSIKDFFSKCDLVTPYFVVIKNVMGA